MTREAVSRWAQRSVAAGAGFLLAWHLAALAGAPRRALVVLALQGFVLHVAFGKAYSLVPSYFDSKLATPLVPAVQVPLTAVGTVLLTAGAWFSVPAAGDLRTLGAGCWAVGVAAFVGILAWTLRGNIAGAETATSDVNASRRPVDRLANAFIPVALAYLLAGTYATAGPAVGLPPLIDGYPARATHLLAAGFAALLLFAVGVRLLPRFMAVGSPRRLAWVILPAGAAGPTLLAIGLPAGGLLHAGAALESVAVVGFAAVVARGYVRTDRDRVGFHGVIAAGAAGIVAATVGTWMAVAGPRPSLAAAHRRLNLLGLLGLSIVGVAYQFYPPAVGSRRVAGDRTALASMALLAGGLGVQAAGLVAGRPPVVAAGEAAGGLGALTFAVLVVGLLVERGEL